MEPNKITLDITSLHWDALLDDWSWLLEKNYSPVLMTAFGDVFLQDENGEIDFLDVMSGKIKKVASSIAELQTLINIRANQDEWLMAGLFNELQAQGIYFDEGQCYSFKIPPALGGQVEPANVEATSIYVHISLLGQIHRQIKDLPPGTKIKEIKID